MDGLQNVAFCTIFAGSVSCLCCVRQKESFNNCTVSRSADQPYENGLKLMIDHQLHITDCCKPLLTVTLQVPGLWDYQQVSAAAAAWAKLTDHTMCSLPFEPRLMHAASGPASFVGHPVVQPLLQQGIGSRQPLVVQLLQQRAAAAAGSADSLSGSSSSRGVRQQALFGVGDAASFWRMFDSLHSTQHTSSSSSDKSDSAADPAAATATTGLSSRKGRPTAAAAAAAAPANGQQADRLLLCLLPGSTESEVVNSMPAFDDVTKALLQQFPNLVAAMILPDLLVEAAVAATNNYSLPVVVLPASSNLSTNALAAAAAALTHPGPESLRAAAAGLPMVCVRGGSLVKDGIASWRKREALPYRSVVNLVMGRRAVPEFSLWQRGGREGAVAAVAELLAAGGSSSSSNGNATGWQDQRAALQDVLLELVPQRQTNAAPAAAAAAAVIPAGSAGVTARVVGVQSPSDAAAAMLLELVALRKQQEAEQLQQALAAGTSRQQ
jgi:lipid A disaccharide synthetase